MKCFMWTESPNRSLSRREILQRMSAGFGYLSLAGLAGAQTAQPLIKPKAKRVIFLFMNGGPSQVDTFSPVAVIVRFGTMMVIVPLATVRPRLPSTLVGNSAPNMYAARRPMTFPASRFSLIDSAMNPSGATRGTFPDRTSSSFTSAVMPPKWSM